MMLGVQGFSILFALVMLYYIFLQFKKKVIDWKELLFWGIIFLGFIVVTIEPNFLNFFAEGLNLDRRMDVITIAGMVFLVGFTFLNHIGIRRNRENISEVVGKIALKKK